MSTDLDTQESLLREMLQELRSLRKVFEDRNKIIDEQFANIAPGLSHDVSRQPAPLKPSEVDATTVNPSSLSPADANQAILQELLQRDAQRRAQAVLETYIKIISTTFDKAATYTNVIVIGGYAAYFGLWTATRWFIPIHQARWSAVFMVISALIFVIFELVKMIRTTEYAFSLQKIFQQVKDQQNADTINQAFAEYDRNIARKANTFIPAWRVCLYSTIATALVSVIILLSAFVSGLFE